MTDMDPALVETVHALRAERDAARAEVARLRAAVEEVCATHDDTQWWPVVPYMDPPNDDEVVEVHVVDVDRIRAALAATEDQP